MKLKEFLRSKIRLKILRYLKNNNQGFIGQLSKELNCNWGSTYNQLKILLKLDLIKVDKEEKARGRSKKRKFYSITLKGIKVITYLEEIPKIKKKLSLLLKED